MSAADAAPLPPAPGAAHPRPVRFYLNDTLVCLDAVPPTRTVLEWLREERRLTGTKEGCAEGDCGACTVVVGERGDRSDSSAGLRWRAINSCITFVPALDGRQLVTVDRLRSADGALHPVQQALVDAYERFCAELDMLADELPLGVDPDSAAADAHFATLPLDPYAAQDKGEFFAVSSEQFFVDPARLQDAFPEWYDLLALFFRQDPAARLRQPTGPRQ
jgi:aerobic-type carbon monoxide dehydrogenase small subunit (CoxS/CutS family)